MATKKPMTEEQKQAAAERMRKVNEARKAKKEQEAAAEEAGKAEQMVIETGAEEVQREAVKETAKEQAKQPTFTQEDVQKMIEAAIEKTRNEMAAQMDTRAPQIIQVAATENERIVMRFQAEVSDENVAVFGEGGQYGKITGKRGLLTIPKSEFTSRFLDEHTRWMLEHRWLVVLSGLTEDERQLYGVDYKAGEVLDEMAFTKMLDMTDKELTDVYPGLCRDYQKMVATRFYTELQQNGKGGKLHNRRELVKKLNDMDRQLTGGETGIFQDVLSLMNKMGM